MSAPSALSSDAARIRESVRSGWIVVAAAFAVMFVGFGCTYSFPAFFSALQETFGAQRAALSWVFSIGAALYFVVGAVSGLLADRFGARRIILFGMVVIAAGLGIASQAPSLWVLYIGVGLGLGVGVGFSYVPSVGAVQRWFVRKRGFASGIAISGIGLGTLLMPKVAEALIGSFGWRATYLVLAALALIGGGAAALFVDNVPERRGMTPDGGILDGEARASGPLPGTSVGEALRSRPFILLYAASAAVSLGLFMPFVHLTPFAMDRGIDHSTAVTLFALIGIGSTAGRFLIGGLADRFGRRRSLAAMYLGMTLMLVWWIFASDALGLAVFALAFGTCYGGFVALAPALIVDYFGPRNASGIIGLSYTAVALGTLLGSPFAGYVFDLSGSYTLPIAVSALASLIGAGLVLLLPDPHVA